MTLQVPKGINAIPYEHIPEQWDKQWFWRFIRTQLGLADTRNATAGSGITITGTANQVATISTTALPATTSSLTSDSQFTSATLGATNLSVTIGGPGTYTIEAMLFFYEDTSGANGFKFDFNGGTAIPSSWNATLTGYNQGTASPISAPAWISTTAVQSYPSIGTSSSQPSWVKISAVGIWVGTIPASFAIRAAQNTANPSNPTHLTAASYMNVFKTA